jgi:hypothetical protein
VAFVQEHFDLREPTQEAVDALAPYRGGVVHPSWAEVSRPEGPAPFVRRDGGLHGVLLLLAGEDGPPSTARGDGPADLGLGGVQPQRYTPWPARRRRRPPGPQPNPRTIGHRQAAGREQTPYLGDRPADGGAVDPAEQAEGQAEDCVGRSCQRWISVAATRSANKPVPGPAPAARRRAPPRAV